MKKAKKSDEKNSLEQLLLKGKSAYEGNKTKTYQYVLIAVAVVVVVWSVQSKLFSGASSKLDAADVTYYAATQAAFSGQGVADGESLKNAAGAYKNSVTGSVLNADAGDAYLSAGQADIVAKQNYSRGVKSTDGEVKTPADPTVNFTAAYEAFMAATSCSDSSVQARAYYGAGAAQEFMASVAAEDAVEGAIEKAKEAYKKAAEISDSPYSEIASKALANLEKGLVVDYYKSIAKKFNTMPEPSEESILSDGADELVPGAPVNNSDEFKTNDDSAETENEASANDAE